MVPEDFPPLPSFKANGSTDGFESQESGGPSFDPALPRILPLEPRASLGKDEPKFPSKTAPRDDAQAPGNEIKSSDTVHLLHESGDLILKIADSTDPTIPIYYCVSSAELRQSSDYFDRLLDPNKFAEGAKVKRMQDDLEQGVRDGRSWITTLPVIEIMDVDVHIPRHLKPKLSQQDVLISFLRVLHRDGIDDVSRKGPNDKSAAIVLAHLACVAGVADRFNAVSAFQESLRSPAWSKTLDEFVRNLSDQPEEFHRQLLLIAIFIDWSNLVEISASLILRGSVRWEEDFDNTNAPFQALWWDLPRGIEEELRERRLCVVDTIFSLQSHLINSYIPKTGPASVYRQQCRLGYGNSPQCDSFQLGEALRFFAKTGMFQLPTSLIDGSSSLTANLFSGVNVRDLLQTLEAAPSYQIDEYHQHCGIRARLKSMTQTVRYYSSNASLGICSKCWNMRRSEVSWQMSGPPRKVYIVDCIVSQGHSTFDLQLPPPESRKSIPKASCHCLKTQHKLARYLFTASEKEWEHECSSKCAFYQPRARLPPVPMQQPMRTGRSSFFQWRIGGGNEQLMAD